MERWKLPFVLSLVPLLPVFRQYQLNIDNACTEMLAHMNFGQTHVIGMTAAMMMLVFAILFYTTIDQKLK